MIELLVSIGVIGLIAVVISAAITVTLRQQLDTEGRISVARWEQSLGMWLPADLASSSSVDAQPDTTPCASADCRFGSNALQLSWNDGSGPTTVAYRYGPSSDGRTFELIRVECSAGSCKSLTVLRDLSAPTDDAGNPITWTAGDAIPDSVINVTVPLEVADGAGESTADARSQRVIVTVNGGSDGDGVDRSARVSFTAGGAALGTLEPASFSGPSFLKAHSGCGGPITLIVDESGSIGSADSNVRAGVRSFVRAFEGTPTQLQIIEMYSYSSTLGAGSAWNKFYDLSEPADVEALIGPTGNSGLVSDIKTRSGSNAYTNWENALFRAFYTKDGQTYAAAGNPLTPTPEMVVFFTDGLPTRDRATSKSDSSSLAPASIPSRFDHTDQGGSYSGNQLMSPRGWYRANWVAEDFDTRIIGVGVGSAFTSDTTVSRTGWPTTGGKKPKYTPIPNEVFLGDLVAAGNDPSSYDGTKDYIRRQYSGADGWGDVSTADILVTSDFSQFGSALTSIALAECGGTLTVQSRQVASSAPADASISYQVGDNIVTTTRIAKSGTFDIALDGVASDTIELVPHPLDGTGYVASGWSCKAGGADLGSAYSLIEPGKPAAGVSVTVNANQAVSCTMFVVPA